MPDLAPRPSDAEMIPLGERLAEGVRAMLNNDGSVPAYKLAGECIAALNAWDEAMEERFESTKDWRND